MSRIVQSASLIAVLFAANLHLPAWPQEAVGRTASQIVQTAGRLTAPALKPGHARPVIVVVADNMGAETTDFVIPYAVLKESGVADVRSLSTLPGPVRLVRALQVEADQTIAQFDAAAPEGADIVIVPAQMKPDSPTLLAWLKQQAGRGATIMSICEGARVLANAGLLQGRRATSHWHSLDELQRHHRDTTWVRDMRYVQDGPVISTTGVTASIPASLALVEAIGGTQAARATADRLDVADWSPAHRTADFRLTTGDYANVIVALGAVWSHETLEAPVADGTDEIALALNTDVWVRSMRTRIVTTHAGLAPVTGRRGLRIIPDAAPGRHGKLMPVQPGPAGEQLELALADMRRRYGASAERLARMGLEYDAPARVSEASPR